MQTPYDRSEESDIDAVCPKCGLTLIMGFESNIIFGMTWDEQTFIEKKHKLQIYVDDLDQQLLTDTKSLASFPAPHQPQRGSSSVLCAGKEGLVTFVTLSCLDGMSNYDMQIKKDIFILLKV